MKKDSGKAAVYILVLLLGITAGIFIGGELVKRGRIPDFFSTGRGKDGNLSYRQDGLRTAEERKNSAADEESFREEEADLLSRNSIISSIKKVEHCVVSIIVTQLQVQNYYYYEDFFDYFLAPKLVPRYKEVKNMGSGFLFGNKGYILTNYHVVEGAQKLYINFSSGEEYKGRVVGADKYSDIAVLAVDRKQCIGVKFGVSENLQVGEWVIALGNPFLNFFKDPNPTVTVGVISALGRDFNPYHDMFYQDMIQTDAAINPGNSGGPLVNTEGEVVGMNTFIYTGGKGNIGSIGIGFAIPIDRAARVASELVKYGHRRKVWTGIMVQDIDRSIALAYGYDKTDGVLVTNIEDGSPGDKAGLSKGDVIIQMDNRIIRNHGDLEGVFLNQFVGDRVKIKIVRNKKTYIKTMVLAEYEKNKNR